MILLINLCLAFFPMQQATTTDAQEIVQLSLDVPALNHILEKSANGDFSELGLVTNGHISSDIELAKFGKKMNITNTAKEQSNNNLVSIEKLKVGAKKARLCFLYKDTTVKVKLVKKIGWEIVKYQMKNSKDNIDVNF